MKIYILSNDDLTSNLIFAPLFDVPDITIRGIAFAASPNRGSSSQLGGALALRRRMAVAYWWYLVLTNMLFRVFEWLTLIFNLAPNHGTLTSLRACARDADVPVRICTDFNTAEFARDLAKLDVDLLLIRVGTILDDRLLEVPAQDTWCVHSSLLPALGGIAGEFHALRQPDMPIGSTVFRVASDLDRGPPLAQVRIERHPQRSVFAHMIANNVAAGHLLAEMLDPETPRRLFNQGLTPSYFSWPKAEQLEELRSGGHRLIGASEVLALLAAALRLHRLSCP